MDKFEEYLRFPDLEKSMEYTSILEMNNIPFQLDDSSMRFNPYFADSPWNNQFILKIRIIDFEQVEKLFNAKVQKEQNNTQGDHYLYTFSDNDILNIIANKKGWTEDELGLAIQIARERNITSPTQILKEDAIDQDEVKTKTRYISTSQKPKKFRIAIFLLVLTFSTSIIYGVTEGYIKASTENQINNSIKPTDLDHTQPGILILEFLLLLGIPFFLIYKMNSRKNWARTIYSFCVAFGAAYFLIYIRYYFDQNFTKAILTSMETILQIISLKLLYSREVNEWYNLKQSSQILQ